LHDAGNETANGRRIKLVEIRFELSEAHCILGVRQFLSETRNQKKMKQIQERESFLRSNSRAINEG
jgi:hypothetical protein